MPGFRVYLLFIPCGKGGGVLKKISKYILLVFTGLIVLLVLAGLFSRDAVTIPKDLKGGYIEVLGEKLRYLQAGKGDDVLLIHGLPGCLEDWSPVMDTLVKRYRVTAYDRPGHGYSGARRTGFSLSSNADTAIELIKVLALKNVIVTGHSYGGGITLAMAAKKPTAVKGFVCVAGVSYPLKKADPLHRIIRIPLLGRGLAVLASATVGKSMVDAGMKNAFHPNEKFMTDEILALRARIFLQPGVIVTLAREALTVNGEMPKLITAYPEIRTPFIIIHGTEDRLLPAEDSRQLGKVLPDSRLEILEGIGHQVQFVRPDSVIDAVNTLALRKQ